MPTKAQLASENAHLRARCGAAEARAASLLADSSGAAEVRRLDAAVAGLEARLADCERRRRLQQDRADRLERERDELRAWRAGARSELSRLRADVAVAHEEWRAQRRELRELDGRRREWAGLARRLGSKVSELRAENRALRARLARSPENSSLPPSSEPARKRVPNSRRATGRGPGAQPGHAGHRRRRHEPGAVVDVTARGRCPECGGELSPVGRESARRVTELVVTAATTEYRGRACECASCGARVPAAFPAHARNEENWGPGVRAAVCWLTHGCNVSIDNARGFLRELTGGAVDVSKGACAGFARELSSLASPLLEGAEASVRSAPVALSDATFTRSEGRQAYIYVFACPDAAVYRSEARKGHAALAGSPVDGNGPQVVCHDHDTSYYSYGTAHAECNAHALRYLRGVEQNEPGREWAARMSGVLADANRVRSECLEGGAMPDAGQVAGLRARYEAALDLADAEYARDGPFHPRYVPEGVALSARLRRYEDQHLLFLERADVPFTNNESERHLRCAKGKLKQSGGFRSTANGQAPYCDFLTVTRTALLRGESPYATVLGVFAGK